MAPMMHPRHQPSNWKGYIGVEEPGTNMSDTGWIILQEIIELENHHSGNYEGVLEHPEHPPGYTPVLGVACLLNIY